MPELLPNTNLTHPPVAPSSEEDDGTFLLSEDMATRLHARETLHKRRGRGELDMYRGEYVIAGPDGNILGHSSRLREAKALAAPEIAANGVAAEHVIWFYVATLD